MAFLLVTILITIFFEVFFNAVVIGFTSPSAYIRLAGLPIILTCVAYVLPRSLEASGKVIWAALLGAHSISFLFQYVETALVSKWSFNQKGPTKSSSIRRQLSTKDLNVQVQNAGSRDRIRYGFFAATTSRNVGTPYEVKGIPRFSDRKTGYVPSKSSFLSWKTVSLLLCYLVIDTFVFVSQPEQNAVNFHPDRIPWNDSRNISFEPLIIRVTSVIGFWINLYCIIYALMGSLAFIMVGIGVSEPKYWPPGFGSITEAYTLRRFWRYATSCWQSSFQTHKLEERPFLIVET